MNRATFRRPWVSLGALALATVSILLLVQAYLRPGNFFELVFGEGSSPVLLLEVSFPLFLVVASPMLFFVPFLRKYSDRQLGLACLVTAAALFFCFDGLQTERRKAEAEKATLDTSILYWSKGLTTQSLKLLSESLQRDPEQPYLAVRLTWMLAKLDRRDEARRWLEAVDKMEIPPYLLPAVQDVRYSLAVF